TASSIGSVQLPPISTLFPYTTLFRSSFHPFYRLIICLNFNFCFVGDIPFVAFREPVRFHFPDQVDRLVDDDALQPRPKCSVPAVNTKVDESADEGLLQYVAGVILIGRDPVGHVVHRLRIQFVDTFESTAVACPATRNQVIMYVRYLVIQRTSPKQVNDSGLSEWLHPGGKFLYFRR